MAAPRNVVLIGFMGSGKTAAGLRLAERLGRKFVDTDSLIEEQGLSIPDIFAAEGEQGFRRREAQAVAIAAKRKGVVVATGGGAPLQPKNLDLLKVGGVVVYLKVSTDEIVRRLEYSDSRPLLAETEPHVGGGNPDEQRGALARRTKRIRDLFSQREKGYELAADVVVDCDGLDPDGVAEEIFRRVSPSSTAGRTSFVDVAVSRAYRVWIGRNLIQRSAALLNLPTEVQRVCIITHPRILRLWGDELRSSFSSTHYKTTTLTFPEGEQGKSLETAARMFRRLGREEFHRTDAIVSLGGGVVCDVAGFIASAYSRGIVVSHIPSTLLAMVDAAIGGKTGVNLPEGKNLVGAFHQPCAVVCDLNLLSTLPEREFIAGLAEVVKYSFIADPVLGELAVEVQRQTEDKTDILEQIVLRSVGIKAGIVVQDEREAGIRAMLNYGHTFGHALETLSLTRRIPLLHHGEAVSIGMVFAAHVSEYMGLAETGLSDHHKEVLTNVGLPTAVSGVKFADVKLIMGRDKKYLKGLRMVLLEKPGQPAIIGDIPSKALSFAAEKVSLDA